MYDLNGKVALVTGASHKRALGAGIARRLAKEGADVAVSSRYVAPEDVDPWEKKEGWLGLDSLVKEIEALGRKGLAVHCDVSKPEDVENMVEKTIQKFGHIDILVNNAGVLLKHVGVVPVVDLSNEDWNKSLNVNLTGVFLTCRAVARHMIKRGQGGKIVNISSVAGKKGSAGTSWYSAAKFGVNGFTQSLAHELAPYQINVNAVCPGYTVTWGSMGKPMYKAMSEGLSEAEAIKKVYARSVQNVPLGRPGTVDDVVNMVAFFASNQSDFMTGQAVNVDGGQVMTH